MDGVTYRLMEMFVREYIKDENLYVLDVGSKDVNGTFKPLFTGHRYVGLDIIPGPNVDVVTEELYCYPFDDETFDIVVSGSTIEHVPDMFSWIKEIARITKRGGLVCIIGPSVHKYQHRYPLDCWRIYPDGMVFLLRGMAQLDVLYAKRTASEGTSIECMGIGRKR